MAFSVLNEPVIPILWPDGTAGNVGIRDAFLHAHEIRDIQGDTPLGRYALLRLLIAFAMDMLELKTSYDRMELLEEGKFDPDALDGYIARCQQNGPRFDLFDEEHPFLQSRYDPKLDAKAEKPVATLFHALPTGNNHIFIDHRMADSHRATPGQSLEALCASYLFCVSGTAGPSSVNNTPPLYVVIVGKNLFETIVFNMLSEREAAPLVYGAGTVPWRSDRVIVPDEIVATVSLLEGLTWMPRRITLIPEERGTVSRVCYQRGLNFQGDQLWRDPHVPGFKKKDESFGLLKPALDRELWRDAGTLLYDHDGKTVRQPQVLRCFSNLFEEEMPVWIRIRAVGLITSNAAYLGWSEGELPVPASLLHNQAQADSFRGDIAVIEYLQSSLFSAVQRHVDKLKPDSKSEEHEIAQQCTQHFLQGAHQLIFGSAINDICNGVAEEEHIEHFSTEVKALLQNTIRQVLRSSGNDAKTILRQMEAEKEIWQAYTKAIKARRERNAGT